MGATPVFYGTRVPGQTLFDYLEGGDQMDDFPDDFSSVNKGQVIKVLQMAKRMLATEKILIENFA